MWSVAAVSIIDGVLESLGLVLWVDKQDDIPDSLGVCVYKGC